MTQRQRGRALAAEVAIAIEEDEGQFDQRHFVHSCGTPSCTAGWTVWVAEGKPKALEKYILKRTGQSTVIATGRISVDAAAKLGLSFDEEWTLFRACPYGPEEEDATAEEAVAALRHYAETGEIAWPEREEQTR